MSGRRTGKPPNPHKPPKPVQIVAKTARLSDRMELRDMTTVLKYRLGGVEPPEEGGQYGDYRTLWNTYMASTTEETLIKAMFGSTPSLDATGDWVYPSINSICVAFETTLPTYSHVDYGLTASYGSATPTTTEPHFLHVHYLTGLNPSTLYHYQITCMDEWSSQVQSEDRTSTTISASGKTAVPGALTPDGTDKSYHLTSGSYYLTQDIHSDVRGITLSSGVTIDLNGFTVYYDEGTPLINTGVYEDYILNHPELTTWGIAGSGANIYNGKVYQDQDTVGVGGYGFGFNPIYGNNSGVIAGVTIKWYSDHTSGIINKDADVNFHHNVMQDCFGSHLTGSQRSQGERSAWVGSYTNPIKNNLVKRARHQGIFCETSASALTLTHNEVHIDSWATNSYSLGYGADGHSAHHDTVTYNKLYLTGLHAIGAGTSSDIDCHDNFIYGYTFPSRLDEDNNPDSGVEGFRGTQYYGDTTQFFNCHFYDNLVILKGSDGAKKIRGCQFFSDPNIQNLVFEGNIVKAVALDTSTPNWAADSGDALACVVCQGNNNANPVPVYYRGNTFIANIANVQFGDDYGVGGNHRFEGNTYEKATGGTGYHTIRIGYGGDTYNNRFISETVGAGCDLEDNYNNGGAGETKDYSIGHWFYILAEDAAHDPIVGLAVTVTDDSDYTYVSAVTDSDGHADVQLLDSTWASNTDDPLTETVRSGHKLSITGYVDHTITAPELANHNTPVTRATITFTV